jgi:eukaryotic-like serine/threonine-protein kinase
LEWIIKKCLAKDREARYQSAQALLLDLKSVQHENSSAAVRPAVEHGTKRPASRIWPALISLIVLLAIGGGLFWWYAQREAPPPPIGRALPLTSDPGFEINPALSPDSKQVAFAWNGDKQDNFDIYIKLVGSNSRLRLTQNPAEDLSPAWSPDGLNIAFLRRLDANRNELLLIPALGGPERKLAETVIVDDRQLRFPALAWSPDGRWLVVSHREAGDQGEGLFLISTQTGEQRRLTRPPANYSRDFKPAFSPDGRALLFSQVSGHNRITAIYLLSLSENYTPVGDARLLKTDEPFVTSPVWTPDGRHIIYLAAVGLSEREQTELRQLAVSGATKSERVLLLEGEINELSLGRHLLYTRRNSDADIWRAEVPPAGQPPNQPQLFISSTRFDAKPLYAPDGKKIAFGTTRSGAWEIWLADADGANPQQLTFFGGPFVGFKGWSPDSQRLIFHARLEGHADLFTIPIAGGAPQRLTTDPSDEVSPCYSHDGRWIYFNSSRSGQAEIWKMPVEGGVPIKLTSVGGRHPVESRDGKTVYFAPLRREQGIWKVPVEGGAATQVTGPLSGLFAFDVSAQGIFYTPATEAGQKYSIRFLSFATGQSRTVVVSDRPIDEDIAISPDQRFLAFTQYNQRDDDLMLIENFIVR